MKTNPTLTVEILKNGCFDTDTHYHCLYCEAIFLKEQIYSIDNHFYTANYAVHHHLQTQHDGPLKTLLTLSSEQSGISDTQKKLIYLMSLDLTDNEIAEQLEISTSTIRNHRFKLREKKKHAQYMLAAIELLEKSNRKMASDEISILNYDTRFEISEKERKKVLESFLDENGKAATIPAKEKSKIILLQYLAGSFSSEKIYSEKEVNQVIQTMFEDFASIRRYLIQYGILARTHDGTKYWKI